MITLGKRGDLHARRQAAAYIRRELVTATDEEGNESTIYALQKLFDDVAPRYADRQVGALWPQGNVRLRTFCIMSQRVVVRGKVKP
jgi:hypothetical protein